ncbi:MAG: UvrD-helicase domain-containing protein, partial [Sphaerochaetaceae bacterium]|nr:UvrD-helicase domain-containing protein [Sphaerochaetaceae bacterium]
MPINLTGALNAEQSKAATTIHGPLLIIAGAGSGKTRVLCYRIAHLLQSNIKPENILALTFTNKAAQEMASRVRDLTKKSLVNLTTSTFHAFGMKVLKKHGHLLGYKSNFTIYDGADQASLLREVLFEEELDPQAYAIDTMLHLFSEIKTERKGWPSDTPQIAKTLYDAYRRHLRLYNAVDFDDLLMLPLDIFTRYPQVLDEYRSRFSHIMVDEFQDTSFEQYRLVKLLAQQSRNLCVVGDDDQSIYSWRGANYQNIILFEKDFPERIEIKLERNYRSTGTILDAANHLIVHNSQRKEKSLWTKSDSGKKIVMLHPQDEEEEIDLIISQMRKISFEQQLSWDNFGILVRTNHLIPAIENKL